MNAFARSAELMRGSLSVIRMQPKLLWFPVVQFLLFLVVIAALVALTLALGSGAAQLYGFESTELWLNSFDQDQPPTFFSVGAILVLMVFGYVSTILSVWTGVAHYRAVDQVLQGGAVSIRDSYAQASLRKGAILRWASFAYVVSVAFAVIQILVEQALEKIPGGGGIAARLVSWVGFTTIKVGWAVGTLFVVPLVADSARGGKETLVESWTLFKKTWGEEVVKRGSVTLVTGLIGFALVLVLIPLVVLLISFAAPTVIALVCGGLFFLIVVGTSLVGQTFESIYRLALMRYARYGEVVGPFSQELLANAYVPSPKLKKQA